MTRTAPDDCSLEIPHTMSAHAIDVEPIDRLADKVKALISILERIRGELSQTVDENLRLSRDVEHLKASWPSSRRRAPTCRRSSKSANRSAPG